MRVLLIVLTVFSIIFLTVKIIIFVKKDEIRESKFETSIQENIEKAYFEGQRDAIEGDIRIKKVDSCYVWTKSCWDSGKAPIFHPPLCK